MIVLVEYPKCSTCAKTRQWLDAQGISYTSRHIKDDRPSYEELKDWLSRSGLPIKRLFNTSGLVYRGLGLKEKLKGMSQDEQLHLLASDGMLVKRPILITQDRVLFGFDETQWPIALQKGSE